MKKRILALLLAGVLTTSLVACVSDGEQDPVQTDEVTSETETTDGTGYTPSEDDLEEDDFWVEETATIYTHSTAYLRAEADGSADSITTVPAASKLTRTKVSTTWSFVTYVNTITEESYEGYISNNYVTKTDITGSDFELVPGGTQTYYALATLNARKYPIAAEYSTKMGSYEKDDEIKVVATNGAWLKVNYETDEDTGEDLYYYVSALYVSAEIGGAPLATNSFEASFVEVVPAKTMYVSQAGYRLRSEPVISKNTVLHTFESAGVKVLVTKEGNVTDEDGEVMSWSYVTAFIPPKKQGDPSTTLEGYIATESLTEEHPGTLNLHTLAEVLALYPTFVTVTPKTMYIVKNTAAEKGTIVNLRSTPEIKSTNIISSVTTKKDAVKPTEIKVVATNNADWYVIERTDTKGNISYAFISADPSYVTSDPTGAVKITMENLSALKNFRILEQQLTITATGVVNGYSLPKVADTVPYPMQAGETATAVAVETGTNPTWYAIDVNGVIYFVSMEFFAPMELG